MTAIWWGMLQAGTPATGTVTTIDTDSGKRPSVYIFAATWYSGTYSSGSYNTAGAGSTIRNNLNTIAGRGAIPQIDWYSDTGNADTAFSLKAIYSQKLHDAFLVQFAKDIAAYGAPILIRLDAEMNGSWHGSYYDKSGFGAAPNTNAPGDFAAMWRYVHNIFVANGATNVGWVWCPNYQPPTPNVTYASIYPGSAYVDWLGVDIYNWGGSQPGGGKTQPWFTFEACMRGTGLAVGWLGDTWTELTALDANLPICVGEFGCDTREGTDTNASAGTTSVWNGQKKADWFTDTFGTQIPGKGATDYSRLKYVAYFNTTDDGTAPPVAGGFVNTNGDWPIEDPTAASGKAGGGIPQSTFQGKDGPGGSAFYARGGQFTLPAGMQPVKPYAAVPQPSRFTNAILFTAPNNLVGWWKLNDPSGTAAVDASATANNGVYTGGFTLAQPKIVRGALDLSALFNGTTGYTTAPSNAAYSLPTTGKLSIVIAFNFVTLPAAFGALISKANVAGTAYEFALRTSNLGILEGAYWNLAGNIYSSAAFVGGSIVAGTTYLAVWTLDQSRTPVGRLGFAAAGAASLTFANSSDTLANTPAAGAGTLDIGRRGDNSEYSNAYVSHAAMWNVAMSDLSANELLAAFNTRRANPRVYVG